MEWVKTGADTGHYDVPPTEAKANLDSYRLIDVREPHEYTGELGHIDGAELVPLAQVPAAANGWDKDQKILLICRSGRRSANAADYLGGLGFEHAHNLLGGMIRWNGEGLPVVK